MSQFSVKLLFLREIVRLLPPHHLPRYGVVVYEIAIAGFFDCKKRSQLFGLNWFGQSRLKSKLAMGKSTVEKTLILVFQLAVAVYWIETWIRAPKCIACRGLLSARRVVHEVFGCLYGCLIVEDIPQVVHMIENVFCRMLLGAMLRMFTWTTNTTSTRSYLGWDCSLRVLVWLYEVII